MRVSLPLARLPDRLAKILAMRWYAQGKCWFTHIQRWITSGSMLDLRELLARQDPDVRASLALFGNARIARRGNIIGGALQKIGKA